MPEERRASKRTPYAGIVHFCEYDGGKLPRRLNKREGQGTDMSFAGMCFTTEKPPQGESLVVSFPAGTAVVRVVQVRKTETAEYAVHCEFLEWLKV